MCIIQCTYVNFTEILVRKFNAGLGGIVELLK